MCIYICSFFRWKLQIWGHISWHPSWLTVELLGGLHHEVCELLLGLLVFLAQLPVASDLRHSCVQRTWHWKVRTLSWAKVRRMGLESLPFCEDLGKLLGFAEDVSCLLVLILFCGRWTPKYGMLGRCSLLKMGLTSLGSAWWQLRPCGKNVVTSSNNSRLWGKPSGLRC